MAGPPTILSLTSRCRSLLSGWRQWRRCSTEVRYRDRAMSVPGRLHHLWTYRCSAVCRRQIVYRWRRGRVRRLGCYTTREIHASSSSRCHATLPDSERSPRRICLRSWVDCRTLLEEVEHYRPISRYRPCTRMGSDLSATRSRTPSDTCRS